MIKVHVRHILRKLGFSSSREMSDYLKELKLLDYYKLPGDEEL